MSSLINAWPAPTPNAPDFGGISEALNSPLQTIRDDFGTARLDHIFSPNDTLNSVYTADDSVDLTPTSTNLYSTDITSLREQVASLAETYVFSPQLLNRASVGYSRAAYYFTGEPTSGTPAAGLGGFLANDPIGAIVVGGSAASNPTAQLALAGSNNGSNLFVYRNLFTYQDSVSFSRGRNQLTLGAWLQRFQSNETLALSQYGQATFTSLQTLLQNTAASLLYDPSATRMYWRSWFGAWFLQDEIRVSNNLTVSFGFRAESTTGWNEAHGHASNYNYPNGVISSQPLIGDSLFTVNRAQFLPQPRLGVAYALHNGPHATVWNAGFGLYNDLQDALGYRADQNAPFNPTYSMPNAAVNVLPLITSPTPSSRARLVPGGVQPDLETPTMVSWTFRMQQQLADNLALIVAYVGSHGYHELIGVDANEPFPVVCPASPCPAKYPATFPAALRGTPVSSGAYYVPTAVRANPSLANTWTYFSEGDSSYNALQVEMNRRFNNGFNLRAAYTWSKAIDDGDSLNSTTSGGEPALASNPFNLGADRGLANFDVRQAAAVSALYALPFSSKNIFLSGWSLTSVVTLQAGFPFTPQLSYNPSNNGDTRNPVRPFVNPDFTGAVILHNPRQWFNPNAFLPFRQEAVFTAI